MPGQVLLDHEPDRQPVILAAALASATVLIAAGLAWTARLVSARTSSPSPTKRSPGSDKQSATKRAELRGKISMLPGLNLFLRVIPGGLLRVDKTKAQAEALGRLLWSVCADHV